MNTPRGFLGDLILVLLKKFPRLHESILRIALAPQFAEKLPHLKPFWAAIKTMAENKETVAKLVQDTGDSLLGASLEDAKAVTYLIRHESLRNSYIAILNNDSCRATLIESMDNDLIIAMLADTRFQERIVTNDRARNKVLEIIATKRFHEGILANTQEYEHIVEIVGKSTLLDELISDAESSFLLNILKSPTTISRIEEDEAIQNALDHLLLNESVHPVLVKLNFLRAVLRSNAFVEALLKKQQLWPDYVKALENEALWHDFQTPLRIRRILRGSRFEHLAVHEEPVREAVKALARNTHIQNLLLSEPSIYRTPAHKARQALVQAFNDLERFYPHSQDEMKQRMAELLGQVTTMQQSRDALLALFCDNDLLRLYDATLKYPDERSLWVLFNELLICEDYYFECDTDTPFIIDGGAHFGFAIYYFKQLFPKAHITAFEPVPDLYTMIQDNVALNQYENVTVLPYALTNVDEEASFLVSDTDSMAGSLSERRRHSGDSVREIHVECRRLSPFIIQTVHYLKLDIEGPEDRVIEEIEHKLDLVERIFIEYHFGEGLPGERLATILAILERSGFETQVAKSFSYSVSSRKKPMQYVGDSYSAVIWACKRSLHAAAATCDQE